MTSGTETLVFGTRSIPSGHRHFQGPGHKQWDNEEFEVQLLAYFLHGQLHFSGQLGWTVGSDNVGPRLGRAHLCYLWSIGYQPVCRIR